MLEELRIQNFAIIDSLELIFAPGFNVITGETGAGKSIMIDALEVLLGGKTDSAFVRSGKDKALIEGLFAVDGLVRDAVRTILEREDLLSADDDASYVTLAREVRENRRSNARVNGITVNAEVLRAIGEALVDVHGQSEHLSLLKPATHIDLLDRYADLIEMRAAMGALVDKVHAVRREIHTLLEDEASLKRRAERLRNEVEEIEAAQLQPGEDDELRNERTRLANSEQLANLTAEAYMLLVGDDRGEQMSAVDQLMQVSVLLNKLLNIDSSLKEQAEMADVLSLQVQELAALVQDYGESVEYNPGRLDEVEERLELINRLRRRFGVTIEDVIAYGEKARLELESIDHSEERLEELRADEDKLLRYIGEMGQKISHLRQQFGKKLGESVVKELDDLRMQNTQFQVAITYEDDPEGCYVGDQRVTFSHTGIDHVEFMMSANPGEPLRPLVKVASGGETARIMLALKRVLSQADQTPTLIFDEIDQGIGGRVGSVVGEKLWSLAGNHQVLCVTHLAQLAGYADRHFRVQKDVNTKHARTEVVVLDEETRVSELAEMLGATGDSGSQTARDILAEATTKKQQRASSKPGKQKQLL